MTKLLCCTCSYHTHTGIVYVSRIPPHMVCIACLCPAHTQHIQQATDTSSHNTETRQAAASSRTAWHRQPCVLCTRRCVLAYYSVQGVLHCSRGYYTSGGTHPQPTNPLNSPDTAARAKRKRSKKGDTGKRFTEGWVEFEDKRVAKHVAEMLNGTTMGGKKRGAYHFDLWNIKYLKRFKWDHLTEEIGRCWGRLYRFCVKGMCAVLCSD